MKEELRSIAEEWKKLPRGARVALEQQWTGLAAGGLACGSAILDRDGTVVAAGRNHAYNESGAIETLARIPLQHNHLAHAELNAIALIPTETHLESFTLWSTQHPCIMCAAAIRFTGIGNVKFLDDDLSDNSSEESIKSSRLGVPYLPLGDPLWWTVSNVLFLYNQAILRGEEASNLKRNESRFPELVSLTLKLARSDSLGIPARSGVALPAALRRPVSDIREAAKHAPVRETA